MKKQSNNIEKRINDYIRDNKVTGVVCEYLINNLNEDSDYWWYLDYDEDDKLTGDDKDAIVYYLRSQQCRLVINGIDADMLTTEDAERLNGCRITTYYEGYAGQDGIDSFVVGDVVSELEYYRNLREDCFPDKKGNRNRAEYWESYMTEDQLQKHRDKLVLLRADGSNTYIYCYDGEHFTCSDSDRWVFFIEEEE